MVLLVLFAVLAGAGTALSPCVLPVLPALLAAGGVGGHRRPLGIVTGLAVTFTLTVVVIAKLADGVGLGSGALRDVAIAALLLAGIATLVPAVGAALEAPLARLSRFGPRSRGEGFLSGLVVGGALGIVYTPCAGPILAAVVTVGAATGRTVAVGIAYAIGSALALLVLLAGGRRLFAALRRGRRAFALQRTLGAVMLATGVFIAVGADVSFDQWVAQHIPNVNLTASLERSHAVSSRLRALTGRRARFLPAQATAAAGTAGTLPPTMGPLPDLGVAPEFTGTGRWFNTPGAAPLSLVHSLRGRVVLVDFWTYTCINCIRTLPYLEAWDARYRAAGLTIVGVHTPEFSFEHDAGNVASAISRFGIRYPVVQDNADGTWNAYGNQYWPADYLIDATGHVRYVAFGEGDYAKTEGAIRSLLSEAGRPVPGTPAQPRGAITPSAEATPETYLGTERAQGWTDGPLPGVHDYPAPPPELALNTFAFSGRWRISGQPAAALSGAGIDAEVHARNVYLVLSSLGGRPRTVRVALDGRPAGAGVEGADVRAGALTVTGQRLYHLISLPTDSTHRLSLRLPAGVSGYAFTFG